MSKKFLGKKAKIEVALELDGRCPNLIAVAKNVAARTGMTLRLAHVVEPFSDAYPPTLVDLKGPLADVVEAIDASRQLSAEAKLRAAAPGTGDAETCLLVGRPSRALMVDAEVVNAAMILVGAGARSSGSYSVMPAGISTALQLMAEANRPVMVVGANCERDLAAPRLKMLIADDLTPGSEDAVRAGLDFARALGDVDVLHLHVNPLTEARLEAAVAEIRASPATSAAREVDAAEVFARTQAHLQALLAERAPEHRALLSIKGSTCVTEVVVGDAADAIDAAAARIGADIVVFGRHRRLHLGAWSWGKMPHREMLAQKRIVLLVPPQS